ncbi:MAG: hypothetical protein P4L65_09300 [Legionella sp.]|nr:hypothetical protein [Legionella sp.]
MPKDISRSLTVTSAAFPGILSAISSGVGGGLSQSVSAAKKASAVLSENGSQRDSLLKSLKALFDDQPELDHQVLETYLDELKDGLIATNESSAFMVRNVLLGLISGVGHVSQIPLDATAIAKQTGKGLSNIEIPTDKIKDASQKASKFDLKVEGSSASVHSVADAASKQGGEIIDKVYMEIRIADNSHAETHAKTAASTSAGGSILTTAALPVTTALVIDTIGQVSKEAGAINHFSGEESASKEGKNVYVASKGVSQETKDSDSQASKLKSHDLEAALSNMEPVADLMSNQSVTSPLSTALIRLIVLSLFVESSRGVNKSAIATAEGQVQKALAAATEQGPSAGVDRIKSIHSNLSSLSNIMRLCAENLGGSPAVKTAAQSSEIVSSRSMSIMLSHVSELAAALRQLVSPQQENAQNPSTNSPVNSVNPKILAQSEAIIQAALDKIEQENGQHIIPGLNQDMASQINTATRAGLASLLSTHSIFSNPSILAAKGTKEAVKINEAQKNEALMATLPGMTQALNAIQASTRNLMAEMEKAMESGVSQNDGSLLATHRSVASNTATLFWATSAILLLCDELVSVCRSFTLIDQERLKAASQKASDVKTKDESAQAAEQISWDSHSEQNNSATHGLTALRLTLSHTGIALMKIAMALHHALEPNMDTVQQNIAMHTLQKTILTSSAYASQYIAEGLLFSAGGASAAPVLLNGSAHGSHKQVHSTDAHLHPAQTHQSEESSKSCGNSSQVTGFSTDMIAGTVTNVLKVLAQGGLIGLDTTLKLIKMLEIISLHRDSHIELRLETQDSSAPNGLSNNTLIEPSVASSAGISAIFINLLAALRTGDQCSETQSTLNAQDKLKDVVDTQIEDIAVLKDDEELRENKKGLKEFYKIIIRLLAPNANAADCDSLVKRLDFGGISLSSYHSLFGAYSEHPAVDLRFAAAFANDDDAQGVLRQFIDQAKENYSLVHSLHTALPEAERSSKAQTMCAHVFEAVFQHYKQVKMSDVAHHGSIRRKIPTRAMFKSDIGMDQEQPRVVDDVPAINYQN